MDANAITTAIGTLGFPIVASCALFWLVVYLTKQHKEENGKMSDALNNNTIALTKLTEKMDK